MPSRLQNSINAYRAQLAAREADAEAQLNAAYQRALSALQPQLDALYQQIADYQGNGEPIPLDWLYQVGRLNSIKDFIASQMQHFGAVALIQTQQLQQQGLSLSLQSAMAQLNALVPAGVSYTFSNPSPNALAALIGATQKGSPLADLFNGFGAEAAQNAAQALIAALILGKPVADKKLTKDAARDLQKALDISRARALTIARTELLRAYRQGNMETYKANSDIVQQWRWSASKSGRTCAACLAMDGSLHDLSEDMASHVNCRCAPSPVATAAWAQPAYQSGEDWLSDQSEKVQRQVLGNKYDGYSNGDFTLQDMVGVNHSDDWGDSVYVKSLKQLQAA